MLLFLEDVVPLEFPDFALNKTDVCVKISLASGIAFQHRGEQILPK